MKATNKFRWLEVKPEGDAVLHESPIVKSPSGRSFVLQQYMESESIHEKPDWQNVPIHHVFQ